MPLRKDISSNPTCKYCDVSLIAGDNWYKSSHIKHDYICIPCRYKKSKEPHAIPDKTGYAMVMYRARTSDVPCTLTREQYSILRKGPCFYCGAPIPPRSCGLDQIRAGVGLHA